MELVKIGELSRRSGVPLATVKFYVREGLISAARKTGRTMSWYDPSMVGRIQSIRELQERQFLPLDVIKETLDGVRAESDDLAIAEAITDVLQRRVGGRVRSRDEIVANGAKPSELEWLARARLAVPDAAGRYRGDDLALLATLGSARKVGLAADMLPFEILGEYLLALNKLVEVELRMFRTGVIGRASAKDVGRLTKAATQLSERLVLLLRRKLLLPTLHRLVDERAGKVQRRPRRSSRTKQSPT